MNAVIYPLEPHQIALPSFAWICELAGKIRAEVIVLGSEHDFGSSPSFHARVNSLDSVYCQTFSPDEGSPYPALIPVLSSDGLSTALQRQVSQNPIGLPVFPAHFCQNDIFRYLDDQRHPYIQLPTDLPLFGPSPAQPDDKAHQHAFYDIFHRARKCYLTDSLFHQLAHDTHLYSYFTKYFRDQKQEPEDLLSP